VVKNSEIWFLFSTAVPFDRPRFKTKRHTWTAFELRWRRWLAYELPKYG